MNPKRRSAAPSSVCSVCLPAHSVPNPPIEPLKNEPGTRTSEFFQPQAQACNKQRFTINWRSKMTASTSIKTWFITGASSGFGMAFAQFALRRGDNVVATARTPAKLDDLMKLAPYRVLVHKVDVTKPAEAKNAVHAPLKRFGRIDYVINNAGYGIVGALEETPEEELRAQM